MQHLFVYGSLLFHPIVEGLTGKLFRTENGTLLGYRRVLVYGADFPAIFKEEESMVEGKLLLNVDNEAIKIITFFEGDAYEKTPVWVDVNGEKTAAFAYTWKLGSEHLSHLNWYKEIFKIESLRYYLDEVIPGTVKAYHNAGKDLL